MKVDTVTLHYSLYFFCTFFVFHFFFFFLDDYFHSLLARLCLYIWIPQNEMLSFGWLFRRDAILIAGKQEMRSLDIRKLNFLRLPKHPPPSCFSPTRTPHDVKQYENSKRVTLPTTFIRTLYSWIQTKYISCAFPTPSKSIFAGCEAYFGIVFRFQQRRPNTNKNRWR